MSSKKGNQNVTVICKNILTITCHSWIANNQTCSIRCVHALHCTMDMPVCVSL